VKYLIALQVVLTLLVAACAVIAPSPITLMNLLMCIGFTGVTVAWVID
jgi:hypothetical protein